MLPVEEVLMRSVTKALASLGIPTLNSMIWRLQKSGVWTSPDTFSINELNYVLTELLGDGSEVIMEKIYETFSAECKADIVNRIDPNLKALERINKILQLYKMEQIGDTTHI